MPSPTSNRQSRGERNDVLRAAEGNRCEEAGCDSWNQQGPDGPGFLVKAEIQRNPGGLAWYALAQWFVEQLAEHIDEFIEEGEDVAREVIEIYESYEDGDSDLYQILPIEAQLFEKEE